jgi:uncharacterized phiE125 gp8 family phage protein
VPSYTVSVQPAVEPVSLVEAKLWARVEVDTDDALVSSLITGARALVELRTNRKLITQTVVLRMDAFPRRIQITQAPVQSITSITYIDPDGVEQTLASSEYTADLHSRAPRIVPAWSKSWPSTRIVPNAVAVTFVAGYGDDASDVPESIKTAMKMIVSANYENRQDVVVGRGYSALSVPETSRRLLQPYRVFSLR